MVEVPKKKVKLYHRYRVFLRSGGFIDGTVVCKKGRVMVMRECRDQEGKATDRCVLPKRGLSLVAQTEPDNLNAALYLADGWDEILFGKQEKSETT